MANMGMSPRKNMGMGMNMAKTKGNGDNAFSIDSGATGDFGVSSTPGGVPSVGHMDRDNPGTHLRDHERGARHPIENRKMMANQANPDHGPHHMNPSHHPAGSVMSKSKMANPKAWGSSY